MSVNLSKAVQENLGYPPLKKIDPNSQESSINDDTEITNKFSQAAIPAVLTALYRYSQTDEGAGEIAEIKNSDNWVNKIFDDNRIEAIKKISLFAKQINEDPEVMMNTIANEAVKVTKENMPANAGIKEVKDFFSNQINNILPYLPVELKMGQLLHDNTLDDNTNKMEGPISSLMQTIGSAFSNPVTGDEIKGT